MKHFRLITLIPALLVALPTVGLSQDEYYSQAPVSLWFSAEERADLVAPVALYPDPVLAHILVASTFPDEVIYASRYVRSNGTNGVDRQPWDVSVKALAHYAPVLHMLADRPDWTTALGQAYAVQPDDVMDSIQELRAIARANGHLISGNEHEVVVEYDRIRIVPVQTRVIYIPRYDPYVVFHRPVARVGGRVGSIFFGVSFPIGGWLSYDCDWYGRRVYYDGWRGGGWRARSRPVIHITNVYVSPRYEVVNINRRVVDRHVVGYGTRIAQTAGGNNGRGGGQGRVGQPGGGRSGNAAQSQAGTTIGGRAVQKTVSSAAAGQKPTVVQSGGAQGRAAQQSAPPTQPRAVPKGASQPPAVQKQQVVTRSAPTRSAVPAKSPPISRSAVPNRGAAPPRSAAPQQSVPASRSAVPTRSAAPPKSVVPSRSAPPQKSAAPQKSPVPKSSAAPPKQAAVKKVPPPASSVAGKKGS